jgi:hypothetical protein
MEALNKSANFRRALHEIAGCREPELRSDVDRDAFRQSDKGVLIGAVVADIYRSGLIVTGFTKNPLNGGALVPRDGRPQLQNKLALRQTNPVTEWRDCILNHGPKSIHFAGSDQTIVHTGGQALRFHKGALD